jgi:glycosyltransferase involved in cell wall biosynthesis
MKVLFFANTEWYLYNFRLALARFLRDQGFEVVMISPPGAYGPRLEAAGFRWIAVPMQRRSLNPWREARLILRLIRIYAQERPHVVHNFTIKCVIYGALAARIVRIKPRVHAVTGLGYVFTSTDLLARLLRPFVRVLLRLALGGESSRLILQNKDDCLAFAHARLIAQTKIRLIRGSGVDTQRFTPAVSAGRGSATFRVLLAARLLWDKGLREYISAASMLRGEGLSMEFLLAGTCDPGNPGSATDQDVERWRRDGTVRPLGHVEDMAALLRECDLVVLPSSYREGVPRSLIEAAASGLAIVATDTPGCRDIVASGVTGLLVAPGDDVGLAAAIRWMVEHPEERTRMGAAGRQRVQAEFDERIVFDRTLAVYRELLPAGS